MDSDFRFGRPDISFIIFVGSFMNPYISDVKCGKNGKNKGKVNEFQINFFKGVFIAFFVLNDKQIQFLFRLIDFARY